MKKFLPLGSVVKLKGATKRVMICGRVQVDTSTQKEYDYSACAFPEGIIKSDEMILFNNEDVDTVYFLGLQDEEEFKFRGFLNAKIGGKKDDN